MFENTNIIVIPRDEYATLVRAQVVTDILRRQCKIMEGYKFISFAEQLLCADDAGEAE